MGKDLKEISASDLIAELQEIAYYFEENIKVDCLDSKQQETIDGYIDAIDETSSRLRTTDQELLVNQGEIARVIRDELEYNEIKPTNENIKTVIEDVCLIDMPQWLHDNVKFAIQEGKVK